MTSFMYKNMYIAEYLEYFNKKKNSRASCYVADMQYNR